MYNGEDLKAEDESDGERAPEQEGYHENPQVKRSSKARERRAARTRVDGYGNRAGRSSREALLPHGGGEALRAPPERGREGAEGAPPGRAPRPPSPREGARRARSRLTL